MPMSDDHRDLAEAIEYIEPTTLSYEEWLGIGMALHESGLPLEVWDGWSRRDAGRYHEGECERKWRGFGQGGDSRIGSGTVAKMARERGWSPSSEGPGVALSWDGELDVSGIVDPTWVEPEELPQTDADPARELSAYLTALFGADEIVGYVCESFERDGRWIPANKGSYTRTCADILRDLERYGTIKDALGAYSPDAGAWIRFNPLTGEGVRNADVADFRYALVESDSLPKEQQLALVKALELPCAAVVDSGGKSIHAIVHVDARDHAEYRERVEKLYDVCRKNGLEPDPQNKNPSRLSRMPGAVRGGSRQRLVSGPCGKATWAEWWEWVQETSDDLPDPESLADAWNNMPELAPPLIDGVLRQGHKMLLAGPSKAGKSFALIELCVAIAEGREWLGWRCAQGRVLYVNLELDPASALHRFRDVYGALGWEPANIGNIDVWNLRGRSVPMDRLAPSLIRRALKTRPIAVVIDPIYKVITGDENSADQMAAFCNQFDKVAQQVGCAVIYCHHHSKGYQGGKRSMDRASGSGVFARDPDALLDMTELEMTDACRAAHDAERTWEAMQALMDGWDAGWRDSVGLEAQSGPVQLTRWAADNLAEERYRALLAASESVKATSKRWTAWRIEGTLREFGGFEPVNTWFEYPTHRADATGALSDLKCEGEAVPFPERQRRGAKGSKRRFDKEGAEKAKLISDAYRAASPEGGEVSKEELWASVEKVYGEGDYQFELPQKTTVVGNQGGSWTNKKWFPLKKSVAGEDGKQSTMFSADLGEPLGWDSAVDGGDSDD